MDSRFLESFVMVVEHGSIAEAARRLDLTAAAVAEGLERRWLAGEAVEDYLQAGRFRFEQSTQNPLLF